MVEETPNEFIKFNGLFMFELASNASQQMALESLKIH